MKKLLMLALAISMLTAIAAKAFAEDVDEECQCGTDEMGECIPCEVEE